MTRFILAIALAGLASTPVVAMEGDMTCADFTAMDSDAQMNAVSAMEAGMMGDTMAAENTSTGGMAAEAMSPEDSTMAVAAACADHPDMMVGETMMGMHE